MLPAMLPVLSADWPAIHSADAVALRRTFLQRSFDASSSTSTARSHGLWIPARPVPALRVTTYMPSVASLAYLPMSDECMHGDESGSA